MAVAAIAHIYVFPAKPYQFMQVSPCGKVTSMQTIAKANLENKEKKPTIVEQKKACFEAPGTSITESVQDMVIGGGEHVSSPSFFKFFPTDSKVFLLLGFHVLITAVKSHELIISSSKIFSLLLVR
ncbi:hypothetical protein MA16_Dca001755 [Dendrobium catenatum]|uniref:Uncharacterized protein n=1 Tax=Dendrobium catenatum TaxID=906689 RepID=A0A2I0XDF5_9ASPA|nr:hypothetical protein MA16_Dca001755 [Dendrobium catenatum]